LQSWDDESLIAALKRREHAAITYAAETYAPKLYRYAYYQLNDAAAAEDLVSEVITRMLEKIDDVRYVGAPFQSWLFSIARNLVTDGYRRKGRAQVLSLDNPLHREATGNLAQLDAEVESMADREALVKVMANLTDEQRQVLTLRIIEGWQPAEIARLLGRSIDSVKSLQYRALQALRRYWERDVEARGPIEIGNVAEEEIG
jgi:RNA polymerase sigma-70 factor (ECF subfamily)